MSDKFKLTIEQALALLPATEMIHTFRSPGANMLLGCDWDRAELIALIEKKGAELSGKQAARMKHGMVVWKDGWLFIETDEEALKALDV